MRARHGTALALALLAGCGSGKTVGPAAAPPTTAAPQPTKPSAPPTPSANDLRTALRLAAISQEEHFTDNGSYTTDVEALPASEVPAGVSVKVVSANATGYCLAASAEGITMYLDSDTGRPSWDRCR